MNKTNTSTLKLTDATTTLQARAGEIILMTGEIGSGKTLWLNRLAALIDLPGAVRVTIDDTGTDKHSVRMLFDRWPCVWLGQTVAEELIFGLNRQPSQQQLEQALSAWGLSTTALDTELQTLNRLESQRLSLAAISLAKPTLTLLDNPTAALPEHDARELIDDIANWAAQSNTIMVVTCNRWHDWRSSASQIWRISAPDTLPQPRGQA